MHYKLWWCKPSWQSLPVLSYGPHVVAHLLPWGPNGQHFSPFWQKDVTSEMSILPPHSPPHWFGSKLGSLMLTFLHSKWKIQWKECCYKNLEKSNRNNELYIIHPFRFLENILLVVVLHRGGRSGNIAAFSSGMHSRPSIQVPQVKLVDGLKQDPQVSPSSLVPTSELKDIL